MQGKIKGKILRVKKKHSEKKKKTIKEQASGRQEMATDFPFNLLKSVGGREARNWKRVSQASKESIRIKFTVKICSVVLERSLERTAVEIFIEKTGRSRDGSRKATEVEMPGQVQ